MKIKNTLLALAAAVITLAGSVNAAGNLSQSEIVNIVVACERVEHDYALYRDRLDADGFANTFTEDGEWGRSNGRIIKGHKDIRQYIVDAQAKEPELHMQFNTTIQITPTSKTTATGISYALLLEGPVPPEGERAVTKAGFQVASESRSRYEITDNGCKIAAREYTTFFVDPE